MYNFYSLPLHLLEVAEYDFDIGLFEINEILISQAFFGRVRKYKLMSGETGCVVASTDVKLSFAAPIANFLKKSIYVIIIRSGIEKSPLHRM